MSDQVRDSSSEELEGTCFHYPSDIPLLSDSNLVKRNSWLSNPSSSLDTGETEMGGIQDIFENLANVQLYAAMPPVQYTPGSSSKREFEFQPGKGNTSGGKRRMESTSYPKSQARGMSEVGEGSKSKLDEPPKRSRSAELHNISERRRRDLIREKIRTLQQLIPNCTKTDQAAVLDDAIEYIKALKNQMITIAGGAICQAESMYPRGIHYTQVPFYSPFFPMRSLGHGMVVPVPNPTSHTATSVLPLSLGVAGLPLMSKPGILPVSQIQLPFTASQTLHTTAATSTVQPRFPSDLSFDYENLGNSNSRNTSQI